MSESRPNKAVTDEELIGVLTAISVVSKRLARKLMFCLTEKDDCDKHCQNRAGFIDGNDLVHIADGQGFKIADPRGSCRKAGQN